MAGDTTARGYGWAHQQLRRQVAVQVAAGGVCCARCGPPIAPGGEFHLDHTDDRSGYVGASHPHCNISAGGRNRTGRARSSEPTNDEMFCGYDGAPDGTWSTDGTMIKCGGGWLLDWWHRPCSRCGDTSPPATGPDRPRTVAY